MIPFFRTKRTITPLRYPCFPSMSFGCTPPLPHPSHARVQIPEAWGVTAGDASVVVQVIDSGLDESHPDLQINRWANAEDCDGDGFDDDNNGYVDDCHGYVGGGARFSAANHGADPCHLSAPGLRLIPPLVRFRYNVADNTPSLGGDGSHGTHCAGTVAADSDNGVGVAGVAGGQTGIPGASLMINTVFGLTATDGFEDALVYGADNGAHISSNSWGYTVPDAFPASIQAAVDYAVEAGVVVVFAAGNDGTDDNWCVGGGVVRGGGGGGGKR